LLTISNDALLSLVVESETGMHFQSGEKLTAREFRRLNPDYFRCKDNWEAFVRCMAFNCLAWVSDEPTVKEAQESLYCNVVGFGSLMAMSEFSLTGRLGRLRIVGERAADAVLPLF